MQVKKYAAGYFPVNWPSIYKTAKLAIPQKPFYTRYILPSENCFFGVQVKLDI